MSVVARMREHPFQTVLFHRSARYDHGSITGDTRRERHARVVR
jgi:hypothetical protein